MINKPLLNSWIQFLPFNNKGRDFIVGDLHGCYDELIQLLLHIQFNPEVDRLISVGDLIDRGPQNLACLQLLTKPWFFSVLGNHEGILLDHFYSPENQKLFESGWVQNIPSTQLNFFLDIIKTLPFVLKIGTGQQAFYVTHAELWEHGTIITSEAIDKGNFKDLNQMKIKCLWSRYLVNNAVNKIFNQFHSPKLPYIFVGHNIVETPVRLEKLIYLDTGAFVPKLNVSEQEPYYGLSIINPATLEHFHISTSNRSRYVISTNKLDLSFIMNQKMLHNQMQSDQDEKIT